MEFLLASGKWECHLIVKAPGTGYAMSQEPRASGTARSASQKAFDDVDQAIGAAIVKLGQLIKGKVCDIFSRLSAFFRIGRS